MKYNCFFDPTLRIFCIGIESFCHSLEVGKDEFHVDNADIKEWVHLVGDMNHVFVFEHSHHMEDGIGLTNIGKELISKPFPF